MEYFIFAIAVSPLVLFGIGFVALLAAALMKPENTSRLSVRLVGMFSTGIGLLTMGLFYGLVDVLSHQFTVGTVIFTGLGVYLGVDTLRKAIAEKQAAGQ